MTNSRLYDHLHEVSLEKYHGKFTARGVSDVEGLLSLTLQDYARFGVTSMTDRERLFRFIQSLKQGEEKGDSVERSWKSSGQNGSAAGQRSSLKRPREASGSISPAIEKPTSKTQALEPKPAVRKSTNTPTPKRNKVKDSVITTGKYYNYGVPSNQAKTSLLKKINAASSGSKIRVCVRKRPRTQAELMNGEDDVVEVTARDTVTITTPKHAVDLTKYTQRHQFLFDEAFDESCSNQEVYKRTAKPLIQTVFNRGKATCFAYGCTGSGKTFTMLGSEQVQGIYLLAASDMFSLLYSGIHGQGIGVWVSFYEIYCGQLFDLLNARTRLFAREDGQQQVCIGGLTEKHVTNVEQLMEVIESGGSVRSTGSTGVNADSSRSHAVLQLQLKSEKAGEKLGRFSFIDLAGSERAADVTDTDKQTRLEGAEINQSLLALKECIRALDQDSKHTPFRQSRLTQVLKDSFIGDSQTCMIANISPGLSCSENTLNTLRYADRVKELKKDSSGDTQLPRPVTVHGTNSQLWPLQPNPAALKGKLLPRVVIEPLAATQDPDKLVHRTLKSSKVSDVTLGARPSTIAKELETRPEHAVAASTRRPLLQSRGALDKPRGINGKCGSHGLTPSPRPSTSPNVAVVRVKPGNMGETNQVGLRAEKNSDGLNAVESRTRFGKNVTKCPVPTRDGRSSKCARMEGADNRAAATTRREKSVAFDGVRNAKSCEEITKKRAATEDTTNRKNIVTSQSSKALLRNVNIEGDKRKDRGKSGSITAREFSENRTLLDSTILKNVQSCGDVPWDRTKTRRTKMEITTSKFQNAIVSSDHKLQPKNARTCEDVLSKHTLPKNIDVGNIDPGKAEENPNPDCRNVQSLEVLSEPRKRHDLDGMATSENSRYSTRLKTKISKLFGSKNVEEAARDQQAHSRLPSHSVNSRPSKNSRSARGHEDQSARDCSLTEEQVLAAHHTQLALVTGLCHEQMVLLRQVDAGNKDFGDYIAELDDILTRKMSSIESLRGKIAKYPLK